MDDVPIPPDVLAEMQQLATRGIALDYIAEFYRRGFRDGMAAADLEPVPEEEPEPEPVPVKAKRGRPRKR